MTLTNLTAAQLRLILRTSEGFPTQHESSKATVRDGELSASRTGHSLASHLRGVGETSVKTKFANLDEMSRALEAALRTPQGQDTLQRLRPGRREPAISVEIPAHYTVAAVVTGAGETVFGAREFRGAGLSRLRCTLVLEGRERAGNLHLHVQTFYPRIDTGQLASLFAAKQAGLP